MNKEKNNAIRLKKKRAQRVRRPLINDKRPRLTVFRSAKHIYAQIIDDTCQITLCGIGTYDKGLKSLKDKKQAAKAVGLRIAEKAKENKVSTVVFDRGAYRFHGRVKALAEGAREGGLKF